MRTTLTNRHAEILFALLAQLGTAGNLTYLNLVAGGRNFSGYQTYPPDQIPQP